ncbi:MAG: hypothetical protein KBC47_02985 [Candidatus Peribacteraceae bacterium]|nr:hypothetical protein [Candidatus Peribacteraceae bacterium]
MKQCIYLLVALITLSSGVPAVNAAAQASITIEQLSPSVYGTWTLLSGDGSSRSSKDDGVDRTGGFSMALTELGQTTLSVIPPPGMSAVISVYNGGELVQNIDSQQYSFPLYTNSKYRFVIRYSLTRLGTLGVTSDPTPLRFRMKGPSGRTYVGRTPHTFKNLPAGKYSLYFPKTDECLQPAVQTIDVEPEKRNTTLVTLRCNVEEEENVDRSRISRRTLREYVEAREVKTRGNRK